VPFSSSNTIRCCKLEKSTLTAVIEARAKATSVTIDPSNVSPEQLAAFQKSQTGVSSALSRLLVSVERYPELKKAKSNFLNQTELEGTENRIKISRDRYECLNPIMFLF
jgi:LemA protein